MPRPLFLGAVVLLVLFGAYYLWPSEEPIIPVADAATFAEKQAFWEDRIEDAGKAQAYAELSDAIIGLPTLMQHHEAHAFGNALYSAEGLDGISVCDNKFLYGCFHAFAIKGVVNEGVASIHRMNEVCREELGKNVSQCQHGIGHGILATLGYSIENLKEALTLCNTLEYPDHLFGCNGGVLMEYSLHGMVEENAPPPVVRDAKDAMEPCASLDEPFLEPCAYWQTQRWVAARADDDRRELAKEMGAWCELLPGGESAHAACIRGIGNKMQVLTEENASRAGEICALVTDTPVYRYLCQKESASRFLFYYPLSEAVKACRGLSAYEENECRIATERKAANFNADGEVFHE